MLYNGNRVRARKEGDNTTIKEVRKQILKMTQQELGELLGISRVGYYLKESGRRRFKADEVLRICKMAGINPMDLEL